MGSPEPGWERPTFRCRRPGGSYWRIRALDSTLADVGGRQWNRRGSYRGSNALLCGEKLSAKALLTAFRRSCRAQRFGWGSIPDFTRRFAHSVVMTGRVRAVQGAFRYAECQVEGFDSPRKVELGGIEPWPRWGRESPGHSVFGPTNLAGGSYRGSYRTRRVPRRARDVGHGRRWTSTDVGGRGRESAARRGGVHGRPQTSNGRPSACRGTGCRRDRGRR